MVELSLNSPVGLPSAGDWHDTGNYDTKNLGTLQPYSHECLVYHEQPAMLGVWDGSSNFSLGNALMVRRVAIDGLK